MSEDISQISHELGKLSAGQDNQSKEISAVRKDIRLLQDAINKRDEQNDKRISDVEDSVNIIKGSAKKLFALILAAIGGLASAIVGK